MTRGAGRSDTSTRPIAIATPLVRGEDGPLAPASWSEAIDRGRRMAFQRHTAAPLCWSAGGPRWRMPTPTRNSLELYWAPTTSTSAPGRIPQRKLTSWPPGRRAIDGGHLCGS